MFSKITAMTAALVLCIGPLVGGDGSHDRPGDTVKGFCVVCW